MSTYSCERQGLYCITVSHCVAAMQYQSSRVCYTGWLQKFGICFCQPVASCGLLLLNTLFCRCAKPYVCAALCCLCHTSCRQSVQLCLQMCLHSVANPPANISHSSGQSLAHASRLRGLIYVLFNSVLNFILNLIFCFA